jgi:hypothetical protein
VKRNRHNLIRLGSLPIEVWIAFLSCFGRRGV